MDELLAKVRYLRAMGKPVPIAFLQQIALKQKEMLKQMQAQPQQIPHKYSAQYANYIGAKPRAQASARIRLGGVY